MSAAPSVSAALEAVVEGMRPCCGLVGMSVETLPPGKSWRYPSDEPIKASESHESGTVMLEGHTSVSLLGGPTTPAGRLTYTFRAERSIDESFLHAITALVGLRLQAAMAEDRAANSEASAVSRGQEVAADLVKLSALSRSLISTTVLDRLLANLADEVVRTYRFARCCIYMRDGNRPQFVARVWRGYADTIARNPVKETEGAIGQAARTGGMVIYDQSEPVSDTREHERSYQQLKGFARALGTSAFVAVPILGARGRCAGVLVADNRGRHEPISSAQTQLLAAFVNLAGIAVDNSVLYAQMQDTLANIRRLKDYTDKVFNSIGVGIVSTDSHGVIVRWNPAAMLTLNRPTRDFKGVRLEDAIEGLQIPRPERNHLLDLVRRTYETGESGHRQRLTLHPQNRPPMTITLMISRLPEHNSERGGIVVIFEDVTQEARMEAEIEKMRRLADIGQLAAKMAHEVRNALSPIRAAAQIIRADLAVQDVSTEWTDIIVAEVDGLSRLTSEMLDFARPIPLELTSVAVASFLEGAVQSLQTFLDEAQVVLTVEVTEKVPTLVCDPVLLGQAVRNILMNAVQSMPEGGTVCVRADMIEPGGHLAIEFRDTGEGIAPDDLDRIFRPFVTTRPKGTGLGLPIVQKIIDQHGGRIDVESTVGQGTLFRLVLPLQPPHDGVEFGIEADAMISRGAIGSYPDR